MNFHRPLLRLASPALAAALLAALVAPVAGCAQSGKSPATPTAQDFTGHLEAAQSVEIRPRVDGTIDRVEFVEGSHVRKGQVLFRIDPRPFRAEAERQLTARKRALVELDLARANHARAQRLSGDEAVSREEFERLASADRVAAGDLAAANAALSAAKLELQFTEVRAPIDGRASRALAIQGTRVSSDSLLTTVVADDPSFAGDDRTATDLGKKFVALLKQVHTAD